MKNNLKISERKIKSSDILDGIWKVLNPFCIEGIVYILPKDNIHFTIQFGEDYVIVDGKTHCLCNEVYFNIKEKELILTKDENRESNITVTQRLMWKEHVDEMPRVKVELRKNEITKEEQMNFLLKKLRNLEEEVNKKDKEISLIKKEKEELILENTYLKSKINKIKNLL